MGHSGFWGALSQEWGEAGRGAGKEGGEGGRREWKARGEACAGQREEQKPEDGPRGSAPSGAWSFRSACCSLPS